MPKITFIKDHKVIQGDGKGPHYKTGESYELELSYAAKYKRRGLAVDYVVPAPAPPVAVAPPAPEPEKEDVEQDGQAAVEALVTSSSQTHHFRGKRR